MDTLPSEILGLIYMFDPTFHTDGHMKIMDDLRFFWRKTHASSALSSRIRHYRDLRIEHAMLVILRETMTDISDVLQNPSFLAADPFDRYASLPDEDDRKQHWFSFIKLHSDPHHGFRHHVRILEEILRRDTESILHVAA